MDAGRSARELRYFNARRRADGLDHLGIQVETPDELHEVYGRLQQAGRPVLEEGATTCCYAKSEKSWITDPQGVAWETFLTSGESTVYGDSIDLGPIRTTARPCCSPEAPQPALLRATATARRCHLLRGGRMKVTIHHNPARGTSPRGTSQ